MLESNRVLARAITLERGVPILDTLGHHINRRLGQLLSAMLCPYEGG
jgi:hypothetical protein